MELVNPFENRSFDQTMEKLAARYAAAKDQESTSGIKKIADYRLPEDPAQWNASIQDALQGQLPNVFEIGGNPHIVYKNQDWGSKCALGSVSIAVGESLLVFPVIIRYGNLAPFDVVYVHNDDHWLHTSEENMRSFESANRNAVFGEVTTKKMQGDNEYDDRWEYLKAPRGSSYKGGRLNIIGDPKTAGRPIVPLAETMDYLRDHPERVYFTSKQAQRLFKLATKRTKDIIKELVDHPKLGSLYANVQTESPATPHFMSKIAEDFVSGIPEFAPQIPSELLQATEHQLEDVDEDLNTDAFKRAARIFFDAVYIKKAGLDNYNVKFGRMGYDGVYEVNGGIDKIADYIADGDRKMAEKILDAIDQAKELTECGDTQESTKGPIEILGDRALVDDTDRISSFGTYDVFTETGERVTGYVIPIMDWSGKQTPFFLFRSDNLWAVESDMHGVLSSGSTPLPNGVLKPDRVGAFVYDKGGRGMAFPPIAIKSVFSSSSGMVIRGVDQGNMESVNIVMSDSVPELMPITQKMAPNDYLPGHQNVYMPTGVKFVPLSDTVTKIATPQKAARLLELKMAQVAGNTIEINKYDNGFRVKIAHQLTPYPPSIVRTMHDLKLSRYDGRQTLSRGEAEFALKMGGALMPGDVVDLMETSNVPSFNAPALNADVLESKIAAAKLNTLIELPSRLRKAARELRPTINDVMNIVTVAPSLQKDASKILGMILDSSKIEKTASLKGARFDDKPTLDDLFELGFLDDESMIYYTNKLQDVEELEDFLCKVLITTRIAGMGIEEDSAQNALYGVSNLKNALKRLSFRVNRTN